MPRYYKPFKPSSNKAVNPGREKKGKPPAPPKNEGKTEESGDK